MTRFLSKTGSKILVLLILNYFSGKQEEIEVGGWCIKATAARISVKND
jgi:hypothetical protein